jgi:sec-independent protein translocase protein TatB
MFGLGFSELVAIGILALILLGPDQLPDLARKLGRFVNDLKRTTDNLNEEFRNAGIHPSRLLDEIKRETETNKNQTTDEKIQKDEKETDAIKNGNADGGDSGKA